MDTKEIKLNEKILKKHDVSLALLFGSQVSGGTHPGSDVDVGILFENPKMVIKNPVEIYGDLLDEFEKVFPGKKIDIVYLHEAPISLQFKAMNDGVVLYEKSLLVFADYKEKIMKFYFDFKFFEGIFSHAYAV